QLAMQNIIPCPSCHRELRVPDHLQGMLVKCPACSTTFTANLPEMSSPIPEQAQPESYPLDSPPPPLQDIPGEPGVVEDENYDPSASRPRRRRRFYVDHRGALVLTLGILSLAVCGFLGPVAWIMGNNDLAAMRAGRMDPSGEGITQA